MNRSILLFAPFVLGAACSDPPPDDPDTGVPSDVGEAGALYVNETAAPGGDGSALHPFQAVDEALAASTADAWVILAPGAYGITAQSAATTVRIDGAGPDLTTLAGLDSLTAESDLRLDSLSLLETPTITTESLALTSVDIVGSCTIEASDVTFDGALIREGTLRVAADTFGATNFDAEEADVVLTAATGTLNGFDVRETPGPALTIEGPGVWTIEDLELTDIGQELEEPDGDAGVCLVIDSADATITDLALLRCAWRGVAVRETATVTITDGIIAGAGNTAVSSQRGATLVLDDVEVSDASVLLFANEATLEAHQVLAERSRNSAVLTGANSTVTITESTFLENPNGHISLLGPGTAATIRANILDGTEFESCFAAASTEEIVEFSGNTVRNCAGAGVAISNGENYQVFDNEISNVFAVEPFPDLAEGVTALRASAEIRDNAIHDVEGAGVAFLNSDGVIDGNEIADAGDAGIRLVERGDAAVVVSNNRIDRTLGAGIAALTVDVTVSGNAVTDTAVSFDDGLGEGVLLASNTSAEVTTNTVTGSAYNGIRFVDGVSGTIEGNTVRESGLNAIHEDCGPFEPNDVRVGDNDVDGDVSICD